MAIVRHALASAGMGYRRRGFGNGKPGFAIRRVVPVLCAIVIASAMLSGTGRRPEREAADG